MREFYLKFKIYHALRDELTWTLLEGSRQVFASKYKFCLPTESELKKAISEERRMIEMEKKLEKVKKEI